MKQFYIGSP